ncbi:D-alanyl-lipoteichoic acid biosynthesis protein DltD [Anaerotruncus colihominis]|jgi:D-alanine transfer protein|uniref:D-alanyl-lipoteichoic acid biosynthesis protein DltD n=2 Tax=Oscillospiraceae TaxID=216572 RepID=A0A845SRZ4_9FIRM|nr:D-alanyl-lipoteichoic acid biosynthesis protein DltD [Anaerotruncus colihominis]
MRQMAKKVFFPAVAMVLAISILFWGVGAAAISAIPPWRDSVGNVNHTEKITGTYLMEQSAAQEDTLLIFGSSELRTTEIPTHPANFFAGKRAGFQVDLIGRGSCQSLIHAMQIAASGDALGDKKVVLITSPQSYVEDGIAPDLFMANFSTQQYLELLADESLSDEVKTYLSRRVAELVEEYKALPDAAPVDPAVEALAKHTTDPTLFSGMRNAALAPYYGFSRWLYDLKDKVSVRGILAIGEDFPAPTELPAIDWAAEEESAIAEGKAMSGNNDFWMLDDYYTTYIGSRLERQKDRENALSYSVSKEYDDLRILFAICREKGIEPLFIHVPLHGKWSDYTGFDAGRRAEYYENVREIAAEYGVRTLDLTGHEYEEYFMCDTMHLGWKGWLAVDQALIDYYYDS